MPTPKTKTLILVFTAAFLAQGFVTRIRDSAEVVPVRRTPPSIVDSAVMSRIARAQAAAILAQNPGATSALPFGF